MTDKERILLFFAVAALLMIFTCIFCTMYIFASLISVVISVIHIITYVPLSLINGIFPIQKSTQANTNFSTIHQIEFLIICIIAFLIFKKYVINASKEATFSIKSKIDCEICMDEKVHGLQFNQCKHCICMENDCAFQYLRHAITDISKYPITCFQMNCETKLDRECIRVILKGMENNSETFSNENEMEDESLKLLSMFDRFSLIQRTPVHMRIHCPNASCDHILLKSDPPLNEQITVDKYLHAQNKEEWKQRKKSYSSATNCSNVLCRQAFGMFSKWKYNCRICGNIYCTKCVRYRMQIKKLGFEKPVAICMKCFTQMFCIQCSMCRQLICYRCENIWHDVCNDGNHSNLNQTMCPNIFESVGEEKSNDDILRNHDFQRCPTCSMIIEKISGCNHMTHVNCFYKYEESGTHFCYCCGQLLHGRNHNEDENGRKHFPNGIFYDCKNVHVRSCVLM